MLKQKIKNSEKINVMLNSKRYVDSLPCVNLKMVKNKNTKDVGKRPSYYTHLF